MNDEPQNEAQEHEGEGRRRHRSEQRHDDNDSVALVDKWWADHVPGSIVAGNTEIYNHMYKAFEDLKRRLARR
jgi:hypothetical protein